MRRILKWVGIVLALLVVTVVSLPFLINVNQFKPRLEQELSSALNRQVKLGNLKLSLLAGEVTADDLSVAEDPAFAKPVFISAKSLAVGAEIWPFLISRKLIVTYLTIDQPQIAMVQAPSGDWNFSSLGNKTKKPPASAPEPAGAPLDLSVKLVKITNGRFTMGRTVGHWKPLVLDRVNLELRDFSPVSEFPFTLSGEAIGGGSIKLNGKAGPINPTDSAMTPVNVSLNVSQLNLAGSGMNDFAPDIGGVLSFDGTGSSDGRNMSLNGKIRCDKAKFSRKGTPAGKPLQLDFAVQHDLRKHAGALRRGDIHIGKAVAHLTGTYAEQGEAMVLNLKLSGPQMPVQELEAMLPALGVVLPAGSRLEGGAASVMLDMRGPADRLVTAGSLAINNTRLAGFDLPGKMAAIERFAGIKATPDTDIETLRATVRVAPEGSSAEDMRLVVPAIGDLSGAGTVSPSNDLDFRMSAKVHTSGFLAVVSDTPIPFTIGGTCAQPQFKPDLKAVAKEKMKSVAGGLLKGLLGGKKN